jgi:hypothetical protein
MAMTKFAAGAAAAVAAALLATAAFAAQGEGGYTCQTWSPAKAGPPVTHCLTWTKVAAARMRAAPCDPATMRQGAMRAECAALMAAPANGAPPSTAG